jgi:hypothetical protein
MVALNTKTELHFAGRAFAFDTWGERMTPMRGLYFAVGLAAVATLCGCDWSGSGDEGSWNDSYSWADFTGTYRSPSGGTIVNQNSPGATATAPGGTSTAKVGNENHGVSRSGTLGHPPVAGSVTVFAKGKQNDKFQTPATLSFTDNGSGVLVSSDTTYGANGTVNYGTGAWTINVNNFNLELVTAAYTYEIQGSAGAGTSSSKANVMIYSFHVSQSGNKLTIADSNGVTYSGQITAANVPSDTTQSGSIRLSFEASSGSVKLVGTFTGDWSGTGTAGQGTLSNRLMEGTYVGKTSASIYAISGSVTLSAPTVASNVPVAEAPAAPATP